MIDVIAVIFTFGIIIFIHELGHFLSGKAFGVKVERFAFGFGPEIAGKTAGDTRYSIRAVPLGGYVKFAGDEPETGTGEPREFLSQKWYKRIAIVVAGPVMNYFLAISFFFVTVLFTGVGIPSSEPVVGSVVAGMPAASAGIQPEDRIISASGRKMNSWQDISEVIHKSAGKKVGLVIKRKEKILKFEITPELNKDLSVGLIGITPVVRVEKVGPLKSLAASVNHAVGLSIMYVRYILDKIIKMEKPEVAGPVGIAQFISKAAHAGLGSLLIFVGQISVMIGLMNLFPIPMLDGGHVVFFTIEGIIRRPVGKKVVETANLIGLSLLVALMIFAFYSDFQRIGLIKFFQRLLGVRS